MARADPRCWVGASGLRSSGWARPTRPGRAALVNRGRYRAGAGMLARPSQAGKAKVRLAHGGSRGREKTTTLERENRRDARMISGDPPPPPPPLRQHSAIVNPSRLCCPPRIGVKALGKPPPANVATALRERPRGACAAHRSPAAEASHFDNHLLVSGRGDISARADRGLA